MTVKAERFIIHNLESVRLENDLVSALVLPGKGADLLEFIWKPLGINCFHRTEVPFDVFDQRDIKKERLKNGNENNLGGWIDHMPHKARYKDTELDNSTMGIAATLPWKAEIRRNSFDSVELNCAVDLPLIPFHLEKSFILADNSALLLIKKKFVFDGNAPVLFTVTEHALFGGGLLDDGIYVDVPAEKAFNAWGHSRDTPPGDPAQYEYPMEAMKFKTGLHNLHKPLPAGYPRGGEFVVFLNNKEGKAGLQNPAKGISLYLHYDPTLFPYLRSWYKTDSEGTVVGLEPANDRFSGNGHTWHYGTYDKIESGESRETVFKLEYIPH
jgi:hypothetical protein